MTTRRPSLAERLAEHPSIINTADDCGCGNRWLADDVLAAIADVGGVVHDSNMDSSDAVGPTAHESSTKSSVTLPQSVATAEGVAALSSQIRAAVRVGHVGPNSAAIIAGGGSVALTPSEADEAAERMIGWVRDLVQSSAIEAFYDGLVQRVRD